MFLPMRTETGKKLGREKTGKYLVKWISMVCPLKFSCRIHARMPRNTLNKKTHNDFWSTFFHQKNGKPLKYFSG